MRCQKCGKEIAADSKYCCFCGAPHRCEHPRNGSFGKKLINAAIIAGIIAASGTILALIMYQNKLNPVLNSPEDITDELISDIIANRLESLTINYEFAGCPLPLEKTISRNESDYECGSVIKSKNLSNAIRWRNASKHGEVKPRVNVRSMMTTKIFMLMITTKMNGWPGILSGKPTAALR